MWRFLFVTWLGMLAMVVLICALPLFSRVAISADLRNVAASASDGQNIFIQVVSTAPTLQQVQQISQQVDLYLKQGGFGAYTQGQPQFIVQTPPISVTASTTTRLNEIMLDGYDPALAAQHVAVLQGYLPQATSDGSVQVALTQDVAKIINVHVGSLLQGHYPATLDAQIHQWTIHVVGIIAPRSTHDLFQSAAISPFGTRYTQKDGVTAYSVLAASQTVSAKSANLQTASEQNATHLVWSYPFNIAQLDADNISQLSQQTSDLQQNISKALTTISGVAFAFPGGDLFNTLSSYNQQIAILTLVLTFLLLITLAIVLFLLSILSDMLVEQQATVIAMLRSRGATRRHIFGAFVMQGIILSLAALLAGPLLSLLLVRLIAQRLLPSTALQVLSVITAHPLQAILDVKWYALIAVVAGLFVMLLAIRQAAKLDIVALRRESSRTKRIPLWRRLNLDYLLILLILAGYGAYVYFWQQVRVAQGADPILYNVLQGLAFIAPPLLVAALLMLFLRLFTRLLHLTSNLAARRRSAPAVLAFAQMERAPRAAVRTVVLLALALAAACFLLTLIATKGTRTSDAATFAVGADFSGTIPASDSTKTFAALKAQYSQVPGVQSTALGYYTNVETTGSVIRIEALDANTYAQTALWTAQNASQPLSALTAQLVSHRTDATTQNVVYALVDSAMWQRYHLSVGERFSIPVDDTNSTHISFIALAEVTAIPRLYDTPINPSNGIGMLVDYQSYAAAYAKAGGTPLTPNAVFLRTQSDAASLANVRKAFPDLADRRLLMIDNQQNSVHLDIVGVLAIAVCTVLVLALIGTLLSSWLNAASRRTNFAVMRALGMASRQIATVLLWEQGFLYSIAFVLGIGLGALLTIFVAPTVSLLDLAGPGGRDNPYDIPSVLTTIPYPQLLLLLGIMGVICLGALLLMARIVSRPSISMTLRMNED